MKSGRLGANAGKRLVFLGLLGLIFTACLLGCGHSVSSEDDSLAKHTMVQLMDWHVSGLWVINCPVAWVQVNNFNNEPIKEITFQYNTFDANGKPLNEGTYTVEGTVAPGATKNFIELYLGIVDLYSERLSVKLLSVRRG